MGGTAWPTPAQMGEWAKLLLHALVRGVVAGHLNSQLSFAFHQAQYYAHNATVASAHPFVAMANWQNTTFMGAGLLARHVLPNVMGPVLVLATIQVATAIITEATLSFLGVGAPPTSPSLGTLIRIGNDYLFSGEWWITVFPGAMLVLIALSVNLLGDWLRDALNPRLR